jgi:hypothetical protein
VPHSFDFFCNWTALFGCVSFSVVVEATECAPPILVEFCLWKKGFTFDTVEFLASGLGHVTCDHFTVIYDLTFAHSVAVRR